MPGFQRARSAEQKNERMSQIKAQALSQFRCRPYHEITLTTLAEGLRWSRANLYKYVRTKEEVFLALGADLRDEYFSALMVAFPKGCTYSLDTISEVWAGIISAHSDWFRLHAILFSILEQNASVERIVEFKRGYYEQADKMQVRFEEVAGIPQEKFEDFMGALNHHAAGIASDCCGTPKVKRALGLIGRAHNPPDLQEQMREFIPMCLSHWSDRGTK